MSSRVGASRRREVSPPTSPSPEARLSRRESSRRASSESPSTSDTEAESTRRQASSSVRRVQLASSSGGAGPRSTRSLNVSSSSAASGARVRRPTPAVARRNSNRLSDFIVDDPTTNEQAASASDSPGSPETGRRRQVSIRASSSGGSGAVRRSASLTATRGPNRSQVSLRRQRSGSSSGLAQQLSWYERLMPDCILNATAPLTGYEAQLDELDDQLSDEELRLLERQRLKRNRRIRRRLLAVVLAASLVSAFFIYRGRASTGLLGIRRSPQGVRETIGEMAHRFEDGLSKTIHDTMGK